MKRIKISLALIVYFAVVLSSCYNDVVIPTAAADPDGPPQPVSFKADLMPLFNKSCALSGCHVSGAHKPYMASDVSFGQITNGGFVNTSLPKQSILYLMINGEMREYIPSAVDRQKVYDWIRNGAQNN
ncbi:hypothetical protein [Emticicia sp. SJ17W-69]|uniref:hypothetical protein n=1 Tax=Emticicia sp. SJ17W-69 TaxID=3421657 RepID=UPI003EB8EB0E